MSDDQDLAELVEALRENPDTLVAMQRLAAVGQLLTGITHETRNILTAVLSFAQVGQRKADDPDMVRHLFRQSEQQLVRCVELLSGVLRTARNHGDSESTGLPGPVDVNEIVRSAAELIHNQLVLHRIRLDVDLGADVPLVSGIPGALNQVVLNLLINAKQATPDDEHIRVATFAEGSDWVIIDVTDSGDGIPDHVRDHIFEPFYTTKPRSEGTGMGLAVSRRIVTSHGGTLSLAGERGRGAVFRIRLPAAASDPDEHRGRP